MISPQRSPGQLTTLAIPTVEQMHDAVRAIPSAPYKALGYNQGPRTFLTVSAGGVRVSVKDEAKADETRIERKNCDTLSMDAVVKSRAAWLNEPMALTETTEETHARIWDELGLEAPAATRLRPILSWSQKSRARMRWTLGVFDYSPLFDCEGDVVMLTLTAPGRYWQDVFPDPRAFKEAVYRLRALVEEYWGEQLIGVWKMEFQKRGAPHLHILTRTLVGDRQRPRTGEQGRHLHGSASRCRETVRACGHHQDRVDFKTWISEAWARVVGVDQVIAAGSMVEYEKHVKAGTGIDYPADTYRDPKRIAVYFSKHGAFKAKEAQNQLPQLWLDAIEAGAPSARFWGCWGLRRAEATVQLAEASYRRPVPGANGFKDIVRLAHERYGHDVPEFAIVMRSVRLQLGMTMVELAADLGVTAPYLSMIETGKRQPAEELRQRIQSRLGMIPDESGIISDIESGPQASHRIRH